MWDRSSYSSVFDRTSPKSPRLASVVSDPFEVVPWEEYPGRSAEGERGFGFECEMSMGDPELTLRRHSHPVFSTPHGPQGSPLRPTARARLGNRVAHPSRPEPMAGHSATIRRHEHTSSTQLPVALADLKYGRPAPKSSASGSTRSTTTRPRAYLALRGSHVPTLSPSCCLLLFSYSLGVRDPDLRSFLRQS